MLKPRAVFKPLAKKLGGSIAEFIGGPLMALTQEDLSELKDTNRIFIKGWGVFTTEDIIVIKVDEEL